MAGSGVFNWPPNNVTWDPSRKGTTIALSGGNLQVSAVSGNGLVLATVGKSTGQWYWENLVTGGSALGMDIGIGNVSANINQVVGSDVNSWGYVDFTALLGFKNIAGVLTSYGPGGYGIGYYVAVALDMIAGTVTMYVNNVSQGVMVTGLTGTIYPAIGNYAAQAMAITTNFAGPFHYTPPAGFIALTP